MKVLGIYSGRHGQNSEYLCKTALKGAADQGAEVEIVNLTDLELNPCIGCKACHNFRSAAVGDCILKDDYCWIDEKIMASDALVIVMPIYEKTVPGEFKILMDRFGPSHDVAFRQWAKEQRAAKDFGDGKTVDERCFKARPVSLIAHGGTDWGQLAIPVMKLWCIPMGFTVVDALHYPWSLTITLDEERTNRAYRSGEHVAKCAADPAAASYLGDSGHCPACHSREMLLGDNNEAECCVCGMKGTLSMENGKIKVTFPQEELALSQMGDGGRQKHLKDLLSFGPKMMSLDREAMAANKRKAMNWLEVSKPER